jgi:hypothetical protein
MHDLREDRATGTWVEDTLGYGGNEQGLGSSRFHRANDKDSTPIF